MRSLDPLTWIGLLVCVGVAAVVFEHPVPLGVLALLSLAPTLAREGGRLRFLGILAVVVWSAVLSQGLFYGNEPRTPVIALGPLALYREGLVHGLVQSLRVVAVTGMGVSVARAVTTDRLSHALVRLGVPGAIAFLAATALRFLPQVFADMQVVREARARRGRGLLRRGPLAWLALEVAMVRPVVARSLRRARTLAEALDARGFEPGNLRGLEEATPMGSWEKGLLGACGVLVLAVAGARILFVLYTAEVVYLPAFRPLYGLVRAWL